MSLFRHPKRPEVGLLPSGDIPLRVRAEASIKVLIVAEAPRIGWLKTESFPLSKSHATHHCRCYRRPSNPRRHYHSRRHRRCRYPPLFRCLTICPLSGAIIPQECPQPPLVAPNSAHFHRSNHCSPLCFFQNHRFPSKATCPNNRVIFKRESPLLVAKLNSSRRKSVPNGSLPRTPAVRTVPRPWFVPRPNLLHFESSRHGR